MNKTKQMLLIFNILSMILPALSWGHKVVVFGYEKNGLLKTESSFSGGGPVIKGNIKLYDMSNKKLLASGVTDSNGMWEIPLADLVPGKQGIEIVLDAGGGHSSTWIMQPEDYGVTALAHSAKIEENKKNGIATSTIINEKHNSLAMIAGDCDNRKLEAMIVEAVGKEIAPLKRLMLRTMNCGPDIRDVVGAVGYLFGIAGIIIWFRSRKFINRN